VLGYAYDYDKHWRFQVDYQSGRENFFTGIPLVLVALEGFSYAAAAAVLRISPKAVEMRLYRARKVLLKQLSALDL